MNPSDSRRVLIIDDNEAIHRDLAKILAPSRSCSETLDASRGALFGHQAAPGTVDPGHEVLCATQGSAGLDLLRAEQRAGRPIAVAVVDGRMPPGWDGLTTIEHLWREFPDLQVILCTAYADHRWDEVVRRLGRTDSLLIVKKPFDPLEIRQAVCALGRKWQLARESQARLDEVRRAQRQVQAIVDYAPSLICLRGLDGRFLLVNGGFCHCFGVTRESVFGRTAAQALPGVLATALASRDEEVQRQGRTVEWEMDLPLPGGDRNLLVTKFSLYGMDGIPYAIATVMTDLSRRKAQEESDRQHQTMGALARMAGAVAHDFNNLLTAIIGHQDLALRRIGEDGVGRRQLIEIGKAAQQAAALSERLLRFSRRGVQVPRPCDLRVLLAEQRAILTELLGPQVTVQVPDIEAPLEILADPVQVGLVLQDLASLAREGMPGGGRFQVTVTESRVAPERADGPPGPRMVQLQVSDSGSGLSPERQASLFEPFVAGGSGLTGLGLSSARAAMTQMGGTISVASRAGRGTTFTLLFPAVEAPSATPAVRCSEERVLPGSTVLVAEDEEAVRALIVQALSDQGYHVLVGSDGQEALGAAWAHAGPIDLLVTDAIMPRLSVAALADRLISRHPQLRVVFMSGYTESQAIRHQIPEGHAYFLQKPFGMSDLVRAAQQALTARSGTGVWSHHG